MTDSDPIVLPDDAEPQALLSLVVAPAVEDALVDWLLEREEVTGFTSFPINGHGASIHSMTAAERVSGHRRMILFQSYMPQAQACALLGELKAAFKGSGMHYWMTRLIAGGHLE
jgi:hypothetical protein